jgi:hypothetical protein
MSNTPTSYKTASGPMISLRCCDVSGGPGYPSRSLSAGAASECEILTTMAIFTGPAKAHAGREACEWDIARPEAFAAAHRRTGGLQNGTSVPRAGFSRGCTLEQG